VNKTHFADPRKNEEFVKNPPPKPAFITIETIPEVCFEERRPIPGKTSGFGAVLDRHGKQEGQRFWNTTFEDTYGKRPAGSTTSYYAPKMKSSKSDPCLLKAAGVSVLDQAHRPEGMAVGVLCGENYKPGLQPSANTLIQRAWLYQQDPAMKNLAYGGKKTALSMKDNETSLPLGDGAHATIQANLDARGGRLARNSTTITKGKGAYYGVSIFADD
jgi:hypothetical protein